MTATYAPHASIQAQMQNIAHTVASRYRRNRRTQQQGIPLSDLEQEAWKVLLEFRARWAPRDVSGEIDPHAFGPLAFSAVARSLARYLWRVSSPVRLPDHACKAEVAGSYRVVSLDALEPWNDLLAYDD